MNLRNFENRNAMQRRADQVVQGTTSHDTLRCECGMVLVCVVVGTPRKHWSGGEKRDWNVEGMIYGDGNDLNSI